MCSENHNLELVLLKLFARSLKGTTLEWYNCLPNHSIRTFDQLMDLFLKRFQANIGSKVTISDFVYCKQKPNEKVMDFISRYQAISTKIPFALSDNDLQCMFIGNLQPALRDKLSLNRYQNFASMCSALTDYQHTVPEFGDSSSNPHGGSFPGTSSNGFQRNKVVANIATTPPIATSQSSQNRVFTKLNDSYLSIMQRLL